MAKEKRTLVEEPLVEPTSEQLPEETAIPYAIPTKKYTSMDELQDWSLLGEVYRGHPSKGDLIRPFTLVHRKIVFGNTNKPGSVRPTHPLNIPEIEGNHLEIQLKDDGQLGIGIQLISIEGFDDNDAKVELKPNTLVNQI